jgi:Zn-dependent peptidase ImmA (M78 family)
MGTGLLPPNPKHWEHEHNGLDLRDDLSITTEAQLSIDAAYALLPNVLVLPHGQMLAAKKWIDHFRNAGQASWSGLAIRLDDVELVLFNDSHPASRVRATLMEEFFHLRLSHQRSALRLLAHADGHRTHDGGIEFEAYASGAAALVPYCSLKRMLSEKVRIAVIARQFGVSPALVQFRCKVCRLYRRALGG